MRYEMTMPSTSVSTDISVINFSVALKTCLSFTVLYQIVCYKVKFK